MEMKKIKITNKKQFECLVATMEKYPPVAKGLKFAEASNINSRRFVDIWNGITKDLNSLGPPIRSLVGWQKVWNDYKRKIKQKLSHNLGEARSTGGGPNQMAHLSSSEDAVVALLQLDKAVSTEGNVFGLKSSGIPSQSSSPVVCDNQETSGSGTSGTQRYAVPDSDSSDEEIVDPLFEVKFTDTMPNLNLQPRQESFPMNDERQELLKTQTEYLKDIRDGVKDIARYTMENYHLQVEKNRLVQESALRNEEKMKYKKALLEYKIQKLELLKRKE